ncbi:hypothetical protein COJ77_00555 [Bacillus cereus]|nr:hypothetical protein COJ77_00555 [Bacillus cereus]
MEKQQQLIIDIKVEVPCLDPNGKGSFLCGRFFDARVWALELDNIKAETTDCSSRWSWIQIKVGAAHSETEVIGAPDREALFASTEGAK